jgi:hypothetical protein
MIDYCDNTYSVGAVSQTIVFQCPVHEVFTKNDGAKSCYVRYWRRGETALASTPTTGWEVKAGESLSRELPGEGCIAITLIAPVATTIRLWGASNY